MPTMHPCAGAAPAPAPARGSPPLDRSCVVPRVELLAFLIQVAAVTVVEDDGREAVHVQTTNRLGAEILVGDDLGLRDELREDGTRATDRAEVHARVLLQRVLHRLTTIALADRSLEAEREQRRRE